MSNTALAQKPKFSVAISTDGYKKLISNALQDPARERRFIASVMSAVSVNPNIQDCDAATILSAALLGEALNLSPSPQLGMYYFVPFNDNKNNRKTATFVLGYKGYLQLAMRSGQYKQLNVMAIKKGELVSYDQLNEVIEVNLIEDEIERDAAETTGYYAMFEYLNGFRKTMYWSKSKMLLHAQKYSPAFGSAPERGSFPGRVSYTDYKAGKFNKKDEWVYSSFWYKDFDGMALKTMIRQLISKWGIMSIEMQQGLESDGHTINRSGTPDFIDGSTINDLDPPLTAPDVMPPDDMPLDDMPLDEVPPDEPPVEPKNKQLNTPAKAGNNTLSLADIA